MNPDKKLIVDQLLQRIETAPYLFLVDYTGLTMPEIATSMALSERTVHRRWQSARAWLLKEVQAAA